MRRAQASASYFAKTACDAPLEGERTSRRGVKRAAVRFVLFLPSGISVPSNRRAGPAAVDIARRILLIDYLKDNRQ